MPRVNRETRPDNPKTQPSGAEMRDEVTITVTAANAGPDEATHTEVDITLPDGLTHQASDSTDYDSASGVWSVGTLASGSSEALTIRATVDPNTHNLAQTVSAEIHALEDIGSSSVVELDPHTDDNTAEATVTPVEATNVDPEGQLILSVAENSVSTATQKVLVGDFLVYEPDSGDTLAVTESGAGHENFTYSTTNYASDGTKLPDGVNRVLVEVADDADLDYEYEKSFAIEVGVSDGKDHVGNEDASIDHAVRLSIMLTDVSDGFTRAVAENSTGGTAVGTFIPVTLGGGNPAYRLSGTGHDKFTVTSVTDGAQISVAQDAILNHEDRASFDLTLHASDNLSNSEDIAVRIVVEDDPNERLAVTLVSDVDTQTVHGTVHFTATVSNSPVASDQLKYRWSGWDVGGGNAFAGNTHSLTHSETYGRAVQREYEFHVWFLNDRGQTEQETTDTVVITWTAN